MQNDESKLRITRHVAILFCVCAFVGCSAKKTLKQDINAKRGVMISDKLDNAEIYYGLGKRIAQGLALLKESFVQTSRPGRYEVDGENLFFIVDEYETKPEEQGRLESHRKYIDIQFVLSGREWIGCRPIEGLQVETPYDAKKDIEFYHRAEPMTRVAMEAGTFAIFWPDDAHMPGRMFDKPQRVKKIVVKVRVE
jgi:YhcH/YjgK/YiaL family protein